MRRGTVGSGRPWAREAEQALAAGGTLTPGGAWRAPCAFLTRARPLTDLRGPVGPGTPTRESLCVRAQARGWRPQSGRHRAWTAGAARAAGGPRKLRASGRTRAWGRGERPPWGPANVADGTPL